VLLGRSGVKGEDRRDSWTCPQGGAGGRGDARGVGETACTHEHATCGASKGIVRCVWLGRWGWEFVDVDGAVSEELGEEAPDVLPIAAGIVAAEVVGADHEPVIVDPEKVKVAYEALP